MSLPEAASLCSMTGFARGEGGTDGDRWAWEIRSVNGRSLDVRCRLPAGQDGLDAIVRQAVGRHVHRGNVTLTLTLERSASEGRWRINRPLLDEIIAVATEIEAAGGGPARLESVLSVRGVIEMDEGDANAAGPDRDAMIQTLTEALEALVEARRLEGRRLAETLSGQLDRITEIVTEATAVAATQPQSLRDRLQAQLADLLDGHPPIPEERLAQEVAVLASKSDVQEELDRLNAHVAQARQLLDAGGAVGRRLDFLCQELNREANTLCSKAADLTLTRLGLDLKATIEQVREQVQNLE